MITAQHPQRGYTLAELMVAVAIVGIVSAFGVPSYLTWLKDLRLENTYQELQASLLTARGEALKTQKTVILCRTGDVYSANPSCDANVFGTSDANANNEWTYGWLVYSGETPGVAYVSADHDLLAAIHTDDADRSVVVTSNAAADEFISYRADGRIDETTPIFAVCDDRDDQEHGYRISFSATGRPIVENFTSDDLTLAEKDCTP